VSLDEEAQRELDDLSRAHRLRTARVVQGGQGAMVTLDGREVLSFASNDYLGLARDPRLVRAAMEEAERSGVGAGASRLIVGNHAAHVELEQAIADWMRCGGVRLFNSGYAANTGVLTSLLAAGDVVFSDELNHASIIDGCRLSRAKVVVYPHADLAALEQLLAQHTGRRRVIVSETLFSMDGDIADAERLAALARISDAVLVLDEAHAVGSRGPEGRGVAASSGIRPDVLVGTLGKALGAFGAFAATTRAVADLLWNRARPLVFSTGLPPMVCAAARAAVTIVRGSEGTELRRVLAAHASAFRSVVANAGGARDSAIVPVVVGDDEIVMRITSHLLERGVFIQGIRPPTVPEQTSRLRVAISAAHDAEHVRTTAETVNDAMRRFT
jgi:8-amino-7-oxononanoate synthase